MSYTTFGGWEKTRRTISRRDEQGTASKRLHRDAEADVNVTKDDRRRDQDKAQRDSDARWGVKRKRRGKSGGER